MEHDEAPWYIPDATRNYLIERAGYKCAICKRSYPKGDLAIDHIWPISKGGKAYLENLQVLCRTCNGQKSDHYLDPSSYDRGYAIPIYVKSQHTINEMVLSAVEDDTK